MKAVYIFVIFAVLFVGFLLLSRSQTQNNTPQNLPTPSPAPSFEIVNIKAFFTIITGNITRNFSATKYHNLSPDVYIKASNPSIVYVTKAGVTWDDFFKTLPMKLTKDCLITGDGETFCDGNLKFFLNDIEDKGLLEKEIKEADKALIKFTP